MAESTITRESAGREQRVKVYRERVESEGMGGLWGGNRERRSGDSGNGESTGREE